MMPWHIGKHADCEGFAVIKDDDGSLSGCHDTEDDAKGQMAALYASEAGEMASIMTTNAHDTIYIQADNSTFPMDDIVSVPFVQEATKDGHPRGDFLVQGDADDPATWHLPVKTNGSVDRRLMGAAKAALTVGFRGQKYEGPDKQAALRKLRAMYESEGLEWTAAEADMSESITELVEHLEAMRQIVARLQERDNEAEQVAESALSEASTGHAIAIEEKQINNGRIVPMTLDVAIIEPGPGNPADNHYYPAEVLRRDAGVFKEAKMYTSDHGDKDVRQWVSTIKSCPVGFTKTGAPIARVVVHDEGFAKTLQALNESGLLHKMECSILGSGKAKRGKLDGHEYNVIEAITSAQAVDWVTKAGAGGRALALSESDASTLQTEDQMDEKETEVQEAETVTLKEEDTETGEQPQEETPEVESTEPEATEDEPEQPIEAALSAEQVDEIFKESGIGEDAKRLLLKPYTDEQQVRDAISEFKQLIKKLSGSGQPFAQGDSKPAQDKQLTEADRVDRYRQIKQRYGLDYPGVEVG